MRHKWVQEPVSRAFLGHKRRVYEFCSRCRAVRVGRETFRRRVPTLKEIEAEAERIRLNSPDKPDFQWILDDGPVYSDCAIELAYEIMTA